ncbi:hypothetical protein [Haloplanus salilacus]|uniref:hypothetical protein n=1 Tax=Haloplanus salilacus TaxID=2949994 RepID=UPI0030CC8EEA
MVGTIEQFGDGRLERIIANGVDERKVRRAKQELARRRRRRRKFMRSLDDSELEEIVSGPTWKLGPYDSRALNAGVDVDEATLVALAEDEIERRERERQREQQQSTERFEPFRVVSL